MGEHNNGIPEDPMWDEREHGKDDDLLGIGDLIHNETDDQLGQKEENQYD